MKQHPTPSPATTSRRQFISQTSKVLGASALAGVAIPHVHAAGDDTVRLALIGSGNRGSGAVANAMQATGSTVKVWAMADLFDNRLHKAHEALSTSFGDRIQTPSDRQYIGFDAYKYAIDQLRPGSGDIAMLTGYAGFRPAQLEYAVKKGVNVFMEKSFAVDPPGVRRVIAAAEEAEKKGLKIAAGLMCRHSPNRQELIKRIRNGDLGDIISVRAYRMQGISALPPKPADKTDLEWQLRNFTKFFWVSGGLWAEMDIHQIDELCWIKDGFPVAAHGISGRAPNSVDCSQNMDSYNAEWTFADGTHAYDTVRYVPKCHTEFATYIHGTKCAAQFSGNVHAGTVRIFKDQRIGREHVAWEAPKEPLTAWQYQWNDFLEAIRKNIPFNQAKRAAQSNLATIIGRAAMHMGRIVTWEEAMASNFAFAPGLDSLNESSEAPLKADQDGRYAAPVPGQWQEV